MILGGQVGSWGWHATDSAGATFSNSNLDFSIRVQDHDNFWEIKEHKDEYIIPILSLPKNIVKCNQHCLHSKLQIEMGPNNPFFVYF